MATIHLEDVKNKDNRMILDEMNTCGISIENAMENLVKRLQIIQKKRLADDLLMQDTRRAMMYIIESVNDGDPVNTANHNVYLTNPYNQVNFDAKMIQELRKRLIDEMGHGSDTHAATPEITSQTLAMIVIEAIEQAQHVTPQPVRVNVAKRKVK